MPVRTVRRLVDEHDPSTARRALAGAGRRLRWLRRLASLAALLAIWQVASSRGWIPPQKLPPPSDVWAAFQELVERGELAGHLSASLGRIGRGLVLGGTAALVLGTIAGFSRLGEELLDAPLQALRVIPNLALASLFIIWFGIGEASKVYLIALGAFFPIYLNTFGGIRNVDNRLVEAARSFGLGRSGSPAGSCSPAHSPAAHRPAPGHRRRLAVAGRRSSCPTPRAASVP